MKSKQLLRTLAAFCTALVLMGGFSVPAYAGGGEEPADGTNDSNVQVEQPEETPPLTPDGNATLVEMCIRDRPWGQEPGHETAYGGRRRCPHRHLSLIHI